MFGATPIHSTNTIESDDVIYKHQIFKTGEELLNGEDTDGQTLWFPAESRLIDFYNVAKKTQDFQYILQSSSLVKSWIDYGISTIKQFAIAESPKETACTKICAQLLSKALDIDDTKEVILFNNPILMISFRGNLKNEIHMYFNRQLISSFIKSKVDYIKLLYKLRQRHIDEYDNMFTMFIKEMPELLSSIPVKLCDTLIELLYDNHFDTHTHHIHIKADTSIFAKQAYDGLPFKDCRFESKFDKDAFTYAISKIWSSLQDDTSSSSSSLSNSTNIFNYKLLSQALNSAHTFDNVMTMTDARKFTSIELCLEELSKKAGLDINMYKRNISKFPNNGRLIFTSPASQFDNKIICDLRMVERYKEGYKYIEEAEFQRNVHFSNYPFIKLLFELLGYHGSINGPESLYYMIVNIGIHWKLFDKMNLHVSAIFYTLLVDIYNFVPSISL